MPFVDASTFDTSRTDTLKTQFSHVSTFFRSCLFGRLASSCQENIHPGSSSSLLWRRRSITRKEMMFCCRHKKKKGHQQKMTRRDDHSRMRTTTTTTTTTGWMMMMKALFSISITVVLLTARQAQALYPGEDFVWTSRGVNNCDDADFCGILEFCTGDDYSTYGYRLPCLEDNDEDCTCTGISGPLIRLVPGNKYQLTLRNAASKVSTITNLHTHGLHIVGSGDSDDVIRHVSGGKNCLDYTWDIAADHPGGTYWYHSHHHGDTEEQVTGGAYGLLIVEDNINLNPTLPLWTKNELLLQIATNWCTLLGNGKEDEVITMEAEQWYRLRVSIVSPVAIPEFLVFDEMTGGCEIYKVANDGIWRSEIPGPSNSASFSFELTGASRADFAIRCIEPNSLVNIHYGQYHAATIKIGDVAVNPVSMSSWTPNRPDFLQDLTSVIVPDSNKNMTFQMAYDNVNGESWDPTTPLATIGYNQVHEWTLMGTAGHPFHLHLYHMQIVTPGGCGPHEEGEWYDTISGTEDCVVRFKTADIGQRCVLHCHILFHEDNGSMAWVDVQGPEMPINDVESMEYSCPVIPTPAPSLSPSSSPAPSTDLPTPLVDTSRPIPSGGDEVNNNDPASVSFVAPTMQAFVAAIVVSWTLLLLSSSSC